VLVVVLMGVGKIVVGEFVVYLVLVVGLKVFYIMLIKVLLN